MSLIEYDQPERFVVGTIGPPGQRVFFVQARSGRRTTSVSLEKTQVAVLADRLNDMLDEYAEGAATEQAAREFADTGPLDTPVEEEFRVGTMGLSWDEETRHVVLEMHAVGDAFDIADVDELASSGELAEDPASDPTQLVLRVRIPAAMARAFAQRSRMVVSAGRPNCPFCALPIDAGGHICPRSNGYRR